MKPIYAVLTGVVLLLVGVLWFFYLWTPTQEEIEDTRAQTEQELAQAQTLRTRAAALREVRSEAPEIEARIAEAEMLVPTDVLLPAILRQVQVVADEAGVELQNLSPTRPSVVEAETASYSTVELSFNVEGTYFQLVDLARRLEDADLMGRGVTWRFGNLGISGEFPNLSGNLGATVYARSPDVPVEEQPAPPTDGDGQPAPTPGDDEEPELIS